MSPETDDQLRRHLRTLAEITTPSPEQLERDVHGRATRRRRRRRAAPFLGSLAAAGLAVAVATFLRDDGPAEVRLVDEAPPRTPLPPTDTSGPSTDEQQSLRIATVRLGRHDGLDRVVIEFNTNLPDNEVTQIDDIARQAGFGPAFAIDDAPNYGECDPAQLSVDGSSFVNVVVPSDWLQPAGIELEPRYRSQDTVKVGEVAVCGPYEGRAHLTIALTQPGEIDTSILDNPGRVIIDIR